MTSRARGSGIVQLVAVEAANHGVHAFHVRHNLHLADVPVAHFALHSGVQMSPMAPCYSREDGVNPHPRNRRLRFVIRREFLNTRPILPEGGMTFHARGSLGESHQPATVGIRVTKLALQAQRQMSLVAIGKRLLGRGKGHGSIMHVVTKILRFCGL
jgi:hypothetical protein